MAKMSWKNIFCCFKGLFILFLCNFFTLYISHVWFCLKTFLKILLATPSATNQSIKAVLCPDSAQPPLIWTIAEIFPIRLVGCAGTEKPHLSRLAPHLNHRGCCCQSVRVKFNNCFAHWFPSHSRKNILHKIFDSKIKSSYLSKRTKQKWIHWGQ